jgi:hypothetical protein
MILYSYCLRYDGGAAPNPYWDICTLAICKPAIRRVAQPGDWIVGIGSSASPVGDISGQVVFAMRVSRTVTMAEYDDLCKGQFPGKIPNWRSKDFRRRVGDCIYDFSNHANPKIRRSVHDERNRKVDLGGKNALLSEHFYYFGDQPRPLPEYLLPIVHQTQGHKSRANMQYAAPFVAWVENAGLEVNRLYGEPQLKADILGDPDCLAKCSTRDLEEDDHDQLE